MICPKCGTENNESARFCKGCGSPLIHQTQASVSMNNSAYQGFSGSNQIPPNTGNNLYCNPQQSYISRYPFEAGKDYTPISMWGYFGYELLFFLPVVGFILLIVFSLGGTQNINVRNFARSFFCFYIVIFLIILIISACGIGAAALFSRW